MKQLAIWKPETGIVDLEVSPETLSASEIPGIKAVWELERQRLSGSLLLRTFTEKLSREWSVETGIIENIYEIERGVTLTLIEHGFREDLLSHGSTNKPREFVLQVLRDQQDALEGIFDYVKNARPLTVSYIKELHAALLRSQKLTEALDSQGRFIEISLLKGEWKKQPNYPERDGKVYTYCPPEQVASEMDKLIEIHNRHREHGVPTEVQAAWLHHRFAQIHPFQDGNGRVARAIASFVLIKDGLFPLVVTQNDKVAYIHALEEADTGNLQPLVSLIAKLQITQFRKASKITENLLVEDDVQAALQQLQKVADKIEQGQIAEWNNVFSLAQLMENNIEQRLAGIAGEVQMALQKILPGAVAFVSRSIPDTSHYYRAQIVENAREHLGYYADTTEYRSWVALKLRWTRQGQIVFALHGIGKPFNGSLICAPFLEFRDSEEEAQPRTTLVPITEEGFVFFHNEDKDRLLQRFLVWREDVIKIALNELIKNL